MFAKSQVANMKMVMELLRNSEGAPTTENLIILRNFPYWFKVFSFKKNMCVVTASLGLQIFYSTAGKSI